MSEKDMREAPLSSPSETRTAADTLPMAGNVVLITGGTGGIGKATAIGLATLGARVGRSRSVMPRADALPGLPDAQHLVAAQRQRIVRDHHPDPPDLRRLSGRYPRPGSQPGDEPSDRHRDGRGDPGDRNALCVALAQFQFRWISWALLGLLISQMVPGIVIANALYTAYAQIGLLNSIPGLIIANAANAVPFGILIVRSFMLGVPSAIVEAAYVDGAGLVRTFLSIVVPVSRNALITGGRVCLSVRVERLRICADPDDEGQVQPVTLGIYTLAITALQLATCWPSIDVDHCRRVRISDCEISCGDDAISLKACEEFAGYGPTSGVVVTNCTLRSTSSAVVVGVEARRTSTTLSSRTV
jgi:Binding-protein-dependent transport system inner membrane component